MNLPPAPVKPGTEPARSLKAADTAPAPALAAKPGPPAKPGTKPSSTLSPKSGTAPATAPARRRNPSAPLLLALKLRGRSRSDEVDVELVPEPLPGPVGMSLPGPPQIQVVRVKEERPLWNFNPQQLDRRDWIMLATGAASVLAAVGIGYGLARLVRKKPEDPPPEDHRAP